MNAPFFPLPSPAQGEATCAKNAQVRTQQEAVYIDLNFPDSWADLYPKADVVALGRLNHERKAQLDFDFDQKGGRW